MKLTLADVWNALVAYRTAYGHAPCGILMAPADLHDIKQEAHLFHVQPFVQPARGALPIMLYGVGVTVCDWQAPGMLTLTPINGGW